MKNKQKIKNHTFSPFSFRFAGALPRFFRLLLGWFGFGIVDLAVASFGARFSFFLMHQLCDATLRFNCPGMKIWKNVDGVCSFDVAAEPRCSRCRNTRKRIFRTASVFVRCGILQRRRGNFGSSLSSHGVLLELHQELPLAETTVGMGFSGSNPTASLRLRSSTELR